MFICMAIIAAATATNAWLMQPVLDEIFIKNQKPIYIIPIAVLLIAILKGLASYFQSILMSFVGFKMVAKYKEICSKILSNVIYLSLMKPILEF